MFDYKNSIIKYHALTFLIILFVISPSTNLLYCLSNNLSSQETEKLATCLQTVDPHIDSSHSTLKEKVRNIISFPDKFCETDIISTVEKVLSLDVYADLPPHETTKTCRADLTQIRQNLIRDLKDYRPFGFSFAVDPNVAFIFDTQNPEFTISFVNAQNEEKQRTYQAAISSVGLKCELSIKLDFIFFLGKSPNFADSTKTIELGKGVDVTIPLFKYCPYFPIAQGIGITYAPFTNVPGSLLIFSIFAPFSITPPGISVVTGGTLTPVL